MRKFTQFIRSEKETRLDVHCFNLKGREGKELYGILKNMEFTFCYVEPDSILAFVTGEYFPRIKEIMKRLEKCYGFTWPKDPAIVGVSDKEINRDFLKKFKRREKKIKTVSKEKFEAYVKVQKSGITNMFNIANVIEAADKIFDVELTREDCIYIMENYKKLMEAFKK